MLEEAPGGWISDSSYCEETSALIQLNPSGASYRWIVKFLFPPKTGECRDVFDRMQCLALHCDAGEKFKLIKLCFQPLTLLQKDKY